jgi:hypothetical protein
MIGDWLGPRTHVDDWKRRKKYFPYRDSNSDLLAVQPIASRYAVCSLT